MKVEDHGLLARLKAGDGLAYKHLYKEYYKPLKLHAFHFLKDEMEAEDQVHNLFIEIMDQQISIHVKFCLLSYLKTCLYHKCLLVLMKRKKKQKQLQQYAVIASHAPADDKLLRHETDRFISRLLSGLPVQRLEACKLVYLENKKYREAATEMGITINSVKTHLRLATRALRKQLGHSKFKEMSILYL
jgi:RNA polymerase sigma-70 factor (ECF subfamily)